MKTESLFYCEECEVEFWVEGSCWHVPMPLCPDCRTDTCQPVIPTPKVKRKLGLRNLGGI